MGAYNIVRVGFPCPSCGHVIPTAIQFKFGDTYQHEYAIGDELRWGGNDVGSKGMSHVVVDGIAESPCPDCGYAAEREFYVHVENDRLTRVEVATGERDFVRAQASYIVLNE